MSEDPGAVQSIGVLGAGTMGAGIAQVFAASGFPVTLADTSSSALERARAAIAEGLEKMAKKGTLAAGGKEAAWGRLTFVADPARAAAADFIIEAVVEDEGLKKALFRDLDAAAGPRTILASNTSSISITRLGAAT